MEFDQKKFKTMVHYVCHTCPDPSKLGKTKLNKILWASEAEYYLRMGKPIVGETYVKMDLGPVSEHLLSVVDELCEEGILEVTTTKVYQFEKYEFVSLREPNMSEFTKEEVELLDLVRDAVCHGFTAESISQLSHNLAWEIAEDGEEIPHYTQLVSRLGDPDDDTITWALGNIAQREG